MNLLEGWGLVFRINLADHGSTYYPNISTVALHTEMENNSSEIDFQIGGPLGARSGNTRLCFEDVARVWEEAKTFGECSHLTIVVDSCHSGWWAPWPKRCWWHLLLAFRSRFAKYVLAEVQPRWRNSYILVVSIRSPYLWQLHYILRPWRKFWPEVNLAKVLVYSRHLSGEQNTEKSSTLLLQKNLS